MKQHSPLASYVKTDCISQQALSSRVRTPNSLDSIVLGLHNVAAACAILIVLLLCACTLVGVAVGILSGVVLATMTIGIIYLVASK